MVAVVLQHVVLVRPVLVLELDHDGPDVPVEYYVTVVCVQLFFLFSLLGLLARLALAQQLEPHGVLLVKQLRVNLSKINCFLVVELLVHPG